MVTIILKGVDEFLAAHVEAQMMPSVARILGISNDDVVFLGVNSTIYHEGVDQTSYQMFVTVELESKFKSKEEELANYILEASENFSVHCFVNFRYMQGKTYKRINKNYNLFVKADDLAEEEEETFEEVEDIFTGNAFETFGFPKDGKSE